MGAGARLAHLGHWHLHRRHAGRFSLGIVHAQCAVSPQGPRFCRPSRPETKLLQPVDAVHRLEPLRHACPAGVKRPRVLQGRERADVAHRAQPSALTLYGRRRLEALENLGHGHCQHRCEWRWLSRLLLDLDVRQQVAGAGSRAGKGHVQRHRLCQPCHSAAALYRRRFSPLDRMARRVSGCEQRRGAGFVCGQGQCVGHARFRDERPQQPAFGLGRWHICRGGG